MSRILVFFLGFIAGSAATVITILIIVFGYNIWGSKSHSIEYEDYWLSDTIAVDVAEAEDCCVVVNDSTSIVWTEF
ncbi:MAG: hypothetical protein K2M68_09755 [Muribaculaceae bacterium]|nr:hypothetical protein [Muribaculaceae bacterium]